MNIATLLFVYNRPKHTRKVIEALEKGLHTPDKLIIYHDGKKSSDLNGSWEEVESIVRDVNWCDCDVVISDHNKGLANSIVDGVVSALKKNEAVIVLEDDCVPAPGFIDYMYAGLEKYKSNKRVWGIGGCSWPLEISRDSKYDVYACGRVSTWGWGTWRDRWKDYSKDTGVIERLRSTREGSVMLDTWGSDLDNMLKASIEGKNDSWAVYWALNVIENNGIYINPYESLITNIGFDGTGTNCGKEEIHDYISNNTDKNSFSFPSMIEFDDKVKMEFSRFKGSIVSVSSQDRNKPKIIVYGTGSLYKEKEELIFDRFYIDCFIDNNKRGYYAGIRIVSVDQIDYELLSDRGIKGVAVLIRDNKERDRVVKDLVENRGIVPGQIIEV